MAFILLFNYDHWNKLFYKNCTLFTPEEWHTRGPPNVPIGLMFMALGIAAQILYIPFLFVLAKKEFSQHSCYKIMFELAVIDLISLPVDSIVSGLQCLLGIHYCTHPYFFYCMASITLSCWYGVTITCVILAWDRFFEILFPTQAAIIFGKKTTFLWLTIPLLYMLGGNFFIPAEFGTVYDADPFFGIEGYTLIHFLALKFFGWNLAFLYANSLVAVIGLSIPYGALCVYFTLNSFNRQASNLSSFQRVMLLQSFAICFEMFIVAIVYVANGLIWEPDFILVFEHATKIFIHGDTPLVYLLLNKSLRRHFLEYIRKFKSVLGLNERELVPAGNSTRIIPYAENQPNKSVSRITPSKVEQPIDS